MSRTPTASSRWEINKLPSNCRLWVNPNAEGEHLEAGRRHGGTRQRLNVSPPRHQRHHRKSSQLYLYRAFKKQILLPKWMSAWGSVDWNLSALSNASRWCYAEQPSAPDMDLLLWTTWDLVYLSSSEPSSLCSLNLSVSAAVFPPGGQLETSSSHRLSCCCWLEVSTHLHTAAPDDTSAATQLTVWCYKTGGGLSGQKDRTPRRFCLFKEGQRRQGGTGDI